MNYKELLNKSVEISKKIYELKHSDMPEGVQICEIYSTYLHVYKGIEILAEEVGAPLKMIERVSEKYPYEYSFMYNGIKILQLSEEPLSENE